MRMNGVVPMQSASVGSSVFFVTDEKAIESNLTHVVEDNKPSNKGFSQKKISVLVVDDDHQVTEFISEMLKTKNDDVVVYVANDGFEAGIKLRELLPDVVLVDLMMPGLGGLELCESIKSSPDSSHIRVFAMTGYTSEENTKNVLAAGAEACLAKPFQSDEVFKLLGLVSAD